ncbi:MAG: T9SS type A sorting domain-containing protein [Ignavibacteriota bacterium]
MKKLLLLIILILPLNVSIGQWTLCNGTAGDNIKKIIKVNNTLFAGVANTSFAGRILKSTDNGANWDSVSTGFILSAIFDVTVTGNSVYFGTYERGVVWSTNEGLTWQQSFVNGINGNGVFNVISSGNIIITRSNTVNPPANTVYHYTSDNGANWLPLYIGTLGFIPNYSYNSDSLFFVASQKGVAISGNHGLNWSMPTNAGLPAFPDGRKSLFAMYMSNGNLYAGCIHGFAYSTDMGNNWVSTNMGFSDFCAFTDFKTANGVVFGSVANSAGANAGVYKTTNNGVNWTVMNSGLTSNPSVSSLIVSGDYLFAGSDYDGIFRMPLSLVTTTGNQNNEIVKEYSLSQNYPNPFNPETKIGFEVPKSSVVNVSVYDINGKLLETLSNQVYNPGKYEVVWNADKYPSGTYFCRMSSQGIGQTVKMLLIK